MQRAIDHWSNKRRLNANKAAIFGNSDKVSSVLNHFMKVQALCREAGLPVPVDALRKGQDVDEWIDRQMAEIRQVGTCACDCELCLSCIASTPALSPQGWGHHHLCSILVHSDILGVSSGVQWLQVRIQAVLLFRI